MNHRWVAVFLFFAGGCSSNTTNAHTEPAIAHAYAQNSSAHANSGSITVTADNRPTAEVSPVLSTTLGMPTSNVTGGNASSGQAPSPSASASRARGRADAGATTRATPPREPAPASSSEPSEDAPPEAAADGGAAADAS